ncbi:MAG: tyrosine-type recombinase/integrase [Clostridiaceae bacterium]
MPGSVQKRGENSYRLEVSGGYEVGKTRAKYRKTVKVEGKTEAEINKKLEIEMAKFITEVENNSFVGASKRTFKDFIEKWEEEYGGENLAPKTYYRYKEMLDERIIPALGHIRLDKLKPIHFVKFYNMLMEDGIRKDGKPGGLSKRTINHHHRLIHSILEYAVKWQVLRENPLARISSPSVPNKEAGYYDLDEIKLLLEKLNQLDDEFLKYKVAVILTLCSGLRVGELMGLTWKEIDFEKQTLRVTQSNQYVPEIGFLTKTPKNDSSTRKLMLPEPVLDLLKVYKKQQNERRLKCGDKWIDTDFIFIKWNGEAMFPYTISTWFPKFLKDNNLRKITFHDLRHTSATVLINAGVNIREVSGRLGHKKTSTTLNIYSHVLKSADKDASDKMGQILFQNENTKSN